MSERPVDDDRHAAQVNAELTAVVTEIGTSMGFEVATEYPVPGGRIDVVWSLRPSRPIPHFDASIPVVGFEIESTWRSRKHVKGDLLNLQDCGVALGVIVLAGSGAKDESLRRFARVLVDRPGAKMLVWTEDDVHALAAGKPVAQPPSILLEETAEPEPTISTGGAEHRGKYRPLWAWLRRQDQRPVTLTFGDVERVMGMTLPDSCREHPAHWHSYQGSAVARAIIDAGWRARQVQINAGTVTFVPEGFPGTDARGATV